MPDYLARFDRGPSTRFDAVTDAAAVDYVRELLADEGADDGESASVYRLDDDGNGTEEYIGEAVAVGDARTAEDHAPRGTDARRTADRYLLDLDAAGAPVGPARPAPARFVPMFAD